MKQDAYGKYWHRKSEFASNLPNNFETELFCDFEDQSLWQSYIFRHEEAKSA
jgi:hypothetical protein